MKPWKIILSIALCLFAIIRLASTCNKYQQREKKNEFIKRINALELAESKIFMFRNSGDSTEEQHQQMLLFNRTLDSAISFYQGRYKEDEKRYKQYLKVLFDYKKIYYAYQGLIKLNKDHEMAKAEKANKYIEVNSNIRNLSMSLDRDRMAALWEVFE